MPCVFPVLFIKGLALVESSRHHHSRSRAHGLVYALGILVSFWAVVALLLGLQGRGTPTGLGLPISVSWFYCGDGAAALFPGPVAGRDV